NNRLSQTASRSSWTGWKRNDPTTYLVKDLGVGFVGTAFEYHFIFEYTALEAGDADSRVINWVLTFNNHPTDATDFPRTVIWTQQIGADDTQFDFNVVASSDGDPNPKDSTVLAVGTTYYCKFIRNNAGKTCTVEIYDAPAMGGGDLVDTITVTCDEFTETLRYVYCPRSGQGAADPNDWSTGYVENLDFLVQYDASEELLGEFIAQHADSKDLLGEFIVRHSDSEELPAEFIVQHDGSEELPAEFEVGQGSVELLGEFIIPHEGDEELLGEFISQQEGDEELLGEFVAQRDASEELLGKFHIRQWRESLPGKFIVQRDGDEELLGEFSIRRDASEELLAEFDVGQDSVELLGEFIVQRDGYKELPAEFEAG
ncbi:unnamed protein product, partial [marine sediment metagenome]